MAGTVKPTTPTAKDKPYDVSGDTLAVIWADIVKKGPKTGGKDRAGLTKADGDINPNYSYKVKHDKTKGIFTCDLATTDVKVTLVNAEIHRPNLKTLKKLSAKAKTEWNRFYKLLMAHEKEHVTAMMAEMKALGGEVVKIKKTVKDADQQTAIDTATKQWEADVTAKIDKAKIDARLKKVNDGLDSKSGHGPTLNTAIV